MLKNALLACLVIPGLWAENKVDPKDAAPAPVEQAAPAQPTTRAQPDPAPAHKHHWYSSISKAFSGQGGNWDWDNPAPAARQMSYSSAVIHDQVAPTTR